MYSEHLSLGALFRTGNLNAITTQFKRIYAFITDFLWEAPRHLLLRYTTLDVPHYNYFASPLHNLAPVLESFHGNDLLFQFGVDVGPYLAYRRYWVSFANHHDPNIGTGLTEWKQYTSTGKETLQINFDTLAMGTDNFRQIQINYLMDHSDVFSG